MYNRYIPQPDGSYRRNRVHDSSQVVQRNRPAPPKDEPPCPREPECPPPKKENHPPKPQQRPQKTQTGGVGDFLRQLLPKDFDIGDLIVVLLLLLMAGDCAEDQNTAMLTLALYLFM